MKIFLAIAGVLFVPACGYAQGAKPCEELKTEIAAKLDARGVKGYSLDIVAKDADAANNRAQYGVAKKIRALSEARTKKNADRLSAHRLNDDKN